MFIVPDWCIVLDPYKLASLFVYPVCRENGICLSREGETEAKREHVCTLCQPLEVKR